MVQHHPPTPDSNEFQQLGFEDLRKHRVQHQSVYRQDENGGYHISSPDAPEYCSPAMVQSAFTPVSMQPYDEQAYNLSQSPPYHSAENMGLGLHMPYHETNALPSSYYGVTSTEFHEAPYSPPTARNKIPLTPKSPESESVRRGRNSQVIVVSSPQKTSKSRGVRASRGKSSSLNKSAAQKIRLDKPLSQLTAHMSDVPLRDIEAWVNRSSEERHKEVEKRNGAVPRPMNSFMLYRSAYAERTKRWCVQNNHQVVSSVSGESWPLEPIEVRARFNEYAATERLNHAKAHPNYKFSPSKTQTTTKKRKGDSSDDDEDEDAHGWAGAEDGYEEWRPSGSRRSKARSSRRRVQDAEDLAFHPSQNHYEHASWEQTNNTAGTAYSGSWQATAVPGMVPLHVSPSIDPRHTYSSQYYARGNMPSPVSDGLRTVSRGEVIDAYEHHMPAAIPGTYPSELFRMHSQTQTPIPYQDHLEPSSINHYEAAGQDIFPGMVFSDRTPTIFNSGVYEQMSAATPYHWSSY